MSEDFRRDVREASRDAGFLGGHVFKWIVIALLIGAGVWGVTTVMRILMAPVNMGTGIIEKTFNADHALESYRWFHGAYNQIEAKKGQIRLSKQALAAAAEDRKEARRVELLGTQQSCQSLVGEYNARATRADTVIFKHPEKFLPGNWPGERRVLSETIELSVCD